MVVEKWDGHGYVPAVIKDARYLAFSDDMNDMTTCPSCGKEVKYGDTYTSTVYYFNGGVFGMSVCEECHRKEYGAYY